jgi:hypothetical protein
MLDLIPQRDTDAFIGRKIATFAYLRGMDLHMDITTQILIKTCASLGLQTKNRGWGVTVNHYHPWLVRGKTEVFQIDFETAELFEGFEGEVQRKPVSHGPFSLGAIVRGVSTIYQTFADY